jgi:hypothetical protein
VLARLLGRATATAAAACCRCCRFLCLELCPLALAGPLALLLLLLLLLALLASCCLPLLLLLLLIAAPWVDTVTVIIFTSTA